MKLIEHLRTNKLLPRNLTTRRRIPKQARYGAYYATLTTCENIASNIMSVERILYNRKLGTVCFYFGFDSNNRTKLKVIDEVS